jgi:hypothetical protein
MKRFASLFTAILIAAPSIAHADPAELAGMETVLKRAIVAARARQMAIIQAPPAGTSPTVPGRAAVLACRAAADDVAATDVFDGTLDLETMTLTSSRAGRSPLIDPAKNEQLIDERCGAAFVTLSESDNFEVTPPHDWGQDILQLPKVAVQAAGGTPFHANLHTCAFDGDWSTFDDVPLVCTLTAR